MIDPEKIRADAAREWQANAAIRSEFTSLETFTAFKLADARGLTRFSVPTVVRHTPGTTRQPMPPQSARIAPPTQTPARITAAPSRHAADVDAAVKEYTTGRAGWSRKELVAHLASRLNLSPQAASDLLIQNVTEKGNSNV